MSADRRHGPHGTLCVPVLLLLAALVGCDGSGQYLIWPKAARTGDTVAVLFNTEGDTILDPEGALLDASVDNITVQLTDPTSFTREIAPRAVIELPAAKGSQAVAGLGLGSFTGLVALFDIPNPWPNGGIAFPAVFDVEVLQDGIPTMGANQLTILGSGGSPLALSPSTPLTSLEGAPMLRLRPAWDPAAAEGFDPDWEIGGVELTLRYSPAGNGDVEVLSAVGNGEATSGLAMATELVPQGGDKRWRVVLLHPPGFRLPEHGCNGSGDCFSGRWSLLDLPLEVDTTGLANGEPAFETAEFQVEDLVVVDRDGARLNPPYTGERFFHLFAANEVVPLPEPGVVLLLTAGVLGLAIVHRLERRRARARGGEDGATRGSTAR